MPTHRLLEEAIQEGKCGNLDRSRQLLGQVIREDPYNADAHFYMGSVYWQESNVTDAASYWCKCLELEPQHEKAQKWMNILETQVPAGYVRRTGKSEEANSISEELNLHHSTKGQALDGEEETLGFSEESKGGQQQREVTSREDKIASSSSPAVWILATLLGAMVLLFLGHLKGVFSIRAPSDAAKQYEEHEIGNKFKALVQRRTDTLRRDRVKGYRHSGKWRLENASYDVQKTNSVLSPYTAVVVFQLRRVPPISEDSSNILEIELHYRFLDGEWRNISARSTETWYNPLIGGIGPAAIYTFEFDVSEEAGMGIYRWPNAGVAGEMHSITGIIG